MSKLKKDPSAFLLAAAIPISILLAAILPALMNNMVAIPTVSTIVTGSKARKFIENQFISPIIDGISTFGARALEDPGCIQRTFCEVTNESSSNHRDSRILQRVLHKASTFVDDKTLDNYGVKNCSNLCLMEIVKKCPAQILI
ncbi:uncharacterized protein CEXT_519911 [Caerostris extrusa]|uniref:Uncharacterized protein n=1 Tax=Caerostris extrusa TaxID=172846 RepID=A0AAV4X4M0_CAEEX|nr:uncharacterized protein CEXT_519911 [Caerostris extrusa]